MSQHTAVYLTMTIGEYLWYYGTILGMSYKQLQSKTRYFIELLGLPPKDTVASTLSGGELRRLQFASASIHEPKLIILDEPTVGIDVITKFHMWQHLVKVAASKESTIILTTHYIEEARLADRVGMIHDSTMAAEDTTENLLRRFNQTTLEGVFLKICYNECPDVVVDDGRLDQQSKRLALKSYESEVLSEKTRPSKFLTNFNLNITWHRLYPVMLRSCLHLYRFPGVFVFFILLPCIQVTLFRISMGSPVGGISMAIANEDAGQIGAKFLSYLSTDVIIQKPYQDYDAGLQALKSGKLYGIIHIKSNFSSSFYKRFTDFNVPKELMDSATITIQMDNTNVNLAKSAEFHMLETFQVFLNATLREAGINPMVAQLPIKIRKEELKALTQPPSFYVLSGQMIQISYFSAITMALFNIYMEKHRGFMEPNFIAGVTPLEIVSGLNLFQAVFLIPQVGGVVLLALPALQNTSIGSIFLLFGLLYVQGFGGTALGIFMSLIFDPPIEMICSVTGVMCFAAGFGGSFWPIEAMPRFFRYMCQSLPFALPSRAVESIIHRGWDLSYFVVYGAFAVSFLWIFVLLAFSFYIFDRKKPTSF